MSKSKLWAVKTELSYGGKEFSIVQPYESKEDAERVVEFNDKYSSKPIEWNMKEKYTVVRWRGTRKEHITHSKKRILKLKKCYNFLNSIKDKVALCGGSLSGLS